MTEKEAMAVKTIRNYMWWSGGASLIPVPWVDLAAVGAVQLKALAEITSIYGVPFQRNRGKAIIASTVGYVLPHAFAYGTIGCMLKAIPVVGTLAGAPVMAGFCAAYTWALGRVFIQHFESGGTFLDFEPEKVKEYFKAQFEEGRRMTTGQNAESPA
ncbi:MAG TPA: DUF697 domain-containing protein [Bryobacteraceae bacterium]|nr:DUF697 domain-containing protein [Bryobacteraceae bacterium]